MSLNDTPSADRIHIGIYGKRNSGKSSLLNAFTGQQISIVSSEPGTTTDPVKKAMEIAGLGPCVFMDTAGFDDCGALGAERVSQTKKTTEQADIALLLCEDRSLLEEKEWFSQLKSTGVSVIPVINKADVRTNLEELEEVCLKSFGEKPVIVSAKQGQGMELLKQRMVRALPENFGPESITGNYVKAGDTVLLVMPQDIQAPKGRLILPQVQTIRDLLEQKCVVISVTAEQMDRAFTSLKEPPSLIVTDSQVFRSVYEKKPEGTRLTSFSVLFAAYKGDIGYYRESAEKIGKLKESSHVLIAECCSHAPLSEDIGREKLPGMLRKKIGQGLSVSVVSGMDFPEDLGRYDLIIQCGACMFHRKYVLSRIERAKEQKIPMTNYGVAIAWLSGILDKIVI